MRRSRLAAGDSLIRRFKSTGHSKYTLSPKLIRTGLTIAVMTFYGRRLSRMIIVDKALEKRHQDGNPISVALVGSGYMGRGIALEILTAMRGMRLVAVCNRTLSGAQEVYR